MGRKTFDLRNENAKKGKVDPSLERYNKEGEAFLERFVTVDESWVLQFDPESKVQSMKYRHKIYPSPRKFKAIASARKVLLTIFLGHEGCSSHGIPKARTYGKL